MSSGYGLNGGPSRCFPFWQELLACYVVNTNTEDDSGKKKCLPVMEDYYECLHHKKEVCLSVPTPHTSPLRRAKPPSSSIRSTGTPSTTRSLSRFSRRLLMRCGAFEGQQAAKTRALQAAYRKAEAKHPREDAPRAGAIRNLGLLGKEEDTREVLGRK